ncbi:MAG: GH3 auxin-responsive promoter family protein [Saprospiraceae bacterium]
MNKIVNLLWGAMLKRHYKQIAFFMANPHEAQQRELMRILRLTKKTEWGKRYDFASIKNGREWAARVPVQDYESVKGDIHRMMMGEKDVLWPGQVKNFAKSSGTTSDKSKYIPVPKENHKRGHVRGGWHLLSLMYHNLPNSTVFGGKTLVIGGSSEPFAAFPETTAGDVSAIILRNMPRIAKATHCPNMDIALMPNFEEKLEKIAQIAVNEDIRMVAGTPTWIIVLLERILAISGKKNIMEVWEHFQIYVHGAVSFIPYRERFRQLIPSDTFAYQETYNASEGYFGIQSDFAVNDMLLLLDNGAFYEFLPMEEWDKEFPAAIQLDEVEVGKSYAILVTTNSGLFRYKIGDTVSFTSINPYRIKITGRTKQFINAFGEEVMVANTDKALEKACHATNTIVKEYTVAPIFFGDVQKGGHEWLIEFEKAPENVQAFGDLLDKSLQSLNSDYEAKRFKNLALERLTLQAVPEGTFYRWMKQRGKLGGQHKVPRLSNQRDFVTQIKKMLATANS